MGRKGRLGLVTGGVRLMLSSSLGAVLALVPFREKLTVRFSLEAAEDKPDALLFLAETG
jgi:hypothetical protein